MRTIRVGENHISFVDDEDYDLLLQHAKGTYGWKVQKNRHTLYARCGSIYMHSLIMKPPPDLEVDHINRNGLDNRKCNLRVCTRTENARNSRMRSDNKSGAIGVWYREDRRRWIAYIKTDNKQRIVGQFKTKEAAIEARLKAEKRYWGQSCH